MTWVKALPERVRHIVGRDTETAGGFSMERDIILIDEDKCTGCGLCIPNCPEGALQIIDGKARLVSDLFCDGLGACLGHCPEGAIAVERREAEAYDERKVMQNVVKQGASVIRAHLEHLADHGETALLAEAESYLSEEGIADPRQAEGIAHDHGAEPADHAHAGGCPGARAFELERQASSGNGDGGAPRQSELRQWPVQLHLVPPAAPWFSGKELLLSADCVAYALADFHKDHLKDKVLAIACPKLDTQQDIYLDKLTAIIESSGITAITVMIMQVPCCRGLLALAQQAAAKAERSVPVSCSVVGIEGEILQENMALQV